FELLHLLQLGVDHLLTGAGRLHFFDQVGCVVIDEIRHQLEIHDFPGHNIADTNDEGDESANCESAAEGYFAAADVLAIRADAKEHHQKRQHHDRVADKFRFLETNLLS